MQLDTLNNIIKGELIFDGNEKQVFATNDPKVVIFHYKDIATAYKNIKRANFPGKGAVNNAISAIFFDYLQTNGIDTHFLKVYNDTDQLCRRLQIIPLEVVVRNYFAGSLSSRLQILEGTKASTPIFDLYYNNDELGDPLINDYQAVALGIVSFEDLSYIYSTSKRINELLTELCTKAGIKLIDFRLEFGRDEDGSLVLYDEISPDTSRFWDAQTDERLDMDRFRRDQGYILAHYEVVLNKLQTVWHSLTKTQE